MPHSSGGGSHSGGSHSSSHSSSGSGSGSGASRISGNTYFPGAKRYVYYKDGVPTYFFTNFAVKPDFKDWKYVVKTFFRTVFAILVCLGSFWTIKRNPNKLNMDYDTKIQILDEVNIVSDKQSLYDSLLRFQDETGITPAILTITDKEWKESYSTLEKYAYDWYVDNFRDEKHWLIVYAMDTDLSDDFDDWAWEGMQGDTTDSILGRKETNFFNSELQKRLLQRDKYDVGQAIASAFDELTPIVMDIYIESDAVVAFVVTTIIAIIFIVSQFGVHPFNKKYRLATKCPAGYTNQEKCEYCDGIYLAGLHKKCPHCGAPIPLVNQPGSYQPDIHSDPVFGKIAEEEPLYRNPDELLSSAEKKANSAKKQEATATYGKNGPTREEVSSKIKKYEEILKATDKGDEDIYFHGI